jgi:hypothetical protein
MQRITLLSMLECILGEITVVGTTFSPLSYLCLTVDPNGPFFYNGMFHLFLQQKGFEEELYWNGAVGWGHLVSQDLAHWTQVVS